MNKFDELNKMGMHFVLVQTASQSKHFKDKKGNRLVLYADGSWALEA
jgi:hypothetical protein